MLGREYQDSSAEQQMEAAHAIAPRASPADHVRLGLLVLLLPELVAALERVIVGSAHHTGARGMAGGLLTYVCNPLDIIGDDLPLGRVDDVLICAIGLRRLEEEAKFALTPRVGAVCDVAAGTLPLLRKDLRDSIEEFVTSLESQTLRPAGRVQNGA
jgi:uncharacterized membrane protein YkvA (DUF1232 family)